MLVIIIVVLGRSKYNPEKKLMIIIIFQHVLTHCPTEEDPILIKTMMIIFLKPYFLVQ